MYSKAFVKLQRLYDALDPALARLAAACGGCGGCCRFDTVDHILYASRLERAYLLAVPPPFPAPDSDPGLIDLIAAGLRCPYQHDARCLARGRRPLGCRLHFCRWPADARLHEESGLDWRYEPLFPL